MDSGMSEKPLRIRGCLRESDEEKFSVVEVATEEDLEKVAKALGTFILECDRGYDLVIDPKNRLIFLKRRR